MCGDPELGRMEAEFPVRVRAPGSGSDDTGTVLCSASTLSLVSLRKVREVDSTCCAANPPGLDGQPKQSVNEEHLGERVTLADPSGASLPNHVHRLDSP
jgi:hypothetical protein